jgi:3-dehydroquinate dehydratase I
MKNFLRVGYQQLITKDKLVVVLTGGEKDTSVRDAVKGVGWVEYRVDEFFKNRRSDLRWELTRRSDLRIIGTVRGDREHQGEGLHISEKERLEIYKRIIPCVDYVDIEIKSRIVGEVITCARKQKKKSIVSYHNFSKTPSYKGLEKIYREGFKLKPDIVKIATSVRSEKDMFTLFSFTHYYSNKIPLVIIPMGVTAIERLIPLYFGSLFTYVSLERQTAPGQISYKMMTGLLSFDV